MGGVEGRLLDLGKVVLRVLVQLQHAHLDQGIILVVPDLGQVEGVVWQFRRIRLRHDLHIEGPAGEVLLFDALVEVTLATLPILGNDRLGLLVGQVLDPLLGFEVELDPVPLVLGVDKAEGVAAEAVHMSVGIRNAPVAHDDGDLVERLGQGCKEIPLVLMAPHVSAGVPFDGVVEVGELERVAHEEHGRVVAHQIPVPFFGVEFHCEAPDVPFGVGGAALTGDDGKAQEAFGFLSDFGKYLGLRVLGDVVGDGEGAVGARSLGVHPPLGDHLPVEVGQLLEIPDILQKLRPAGSGGHHVLVVHDGRTHVGGQLFLFVFHGRSPFEL